jgi:hypothetical protein
MSDPLATLRRDPRLWTARGVAARPAGEAATVASGIAALDAVLPGGGWPLGALTELLLPEPGRGELTLLLPAQARLAHAADARAAPRWLCWIAPPLLPYAPALAAAGLPLQRLLLVHAQGTRAGRDRLWAAEQALVSGQCAAVLVWLVEPPYPALRRLQLAAADADAWAVALCPGHGAARRSPAALRLRLDGDGGVSVLRCRGGRPVRLDPAALQPVTEAGS